MKIPHILLASTLFFPMLSYAQVSADSEIMQVAGKSITKGEFEYTYRKNIQQQSDKTPLDEYVTLFENYKLKVAEAESQGIDTTQQFLAEFEGYRNQLVKPYMVDASAEEKLAHEAYDRLLEEVEASHILFTVAPTATQAEKKAAYQKAMEVRNMAMGGADFASLARQYSEDPSAQRNGGYLGHFGAFYMVYPFEKAAYETPVGEISMPVESQFGYHLIKVTGRRPTRAVSLSHIMLKVSQNAPEEKQKAQEAKAWALYKRIQNGEDFAALARQYSEDPSSSANGGLLPLLSTGQIIPSFENAAFALTKVGEVSTPVRTEFGWHIIKLLGEKRPESYEKMREFIVRRMARDERSDAGHKMFVENLKAEKHFAWNDAVKNQIEKSIADTAFYGRLAQMDEPLFSFAGKSYPASGLLRYAKAGKSPDNRSLVELRKWIDQYVDDALIEYETAELCRTNDEFRYLLQEYRDGMLLFEVSNREVWNKALEDESGLKKYFRKNKKKYAWDTPRYKGYVISGDDSLMVKEAQKRLSKVKPDREDAVIAELYEEYNDSTRHISIEKGLYQQGMNAVVDTRIFMAGNADTVQTALPVKAVCGKLIGTPESYEEVKGPVISDYQNYLEQKWVRKLRKKYPITVNDEVLASVKPIDE